MNDWTVPQPVPSAFCAMGQKKQATPGVRPVIVREKFCGLEPEPSDVPPLIGVRVPELSLGIIGLTVEYRNQPVVLARLGLALPLSVAGLPRRK